MTLTSTQLQAFARVAETLLPTQAKGGPTLAEVYPLLPHDRDRADLRRLLDLLGSKAGGLLLYGQPRPFVSLSPRLRAEAFSAMQRHPVDQVRQGAHALKSLVALMALTTDDPSTPPRAWEEIGYPGPGGPSPGRAKTIPIETITHDTHLDADVVVVGSGAGGGVVAGVLAKAGLNVLVLEAGGYSNESDYSHLESDAYRRMYLHAALGSTSDGGLSILAGATLGGGTVINYTTSLPTSPTLREEWDRLAGFDQVFTGDSFDASLEAVNARLGVNTSNGTPSSRDQLMEKGLRALGWHVAEQPRNAEGCSMEDCGYCTMGCRRGAKRSTLLTYLQDAADSHASFVVGAHVDAVTFDRGRVTGVVGRVGEHRITARAPAVVLAAGALNTPAILLRSGLGGPAVGDNLALHPVTALWGRFQERVELWTGTLQARYSDQFADLDGEGFGFKFETAPVHPFFPGVLIGWDDAESFWGDLAGLAHLTVLGVLLRDRGRGRVVIRRDGTPVWKYRISPSDQRHLRQGVKRGAQLLAAAGAGEVLPSTIRPVRYRPGNETLNDFIQRVDEVGYGSNQTIYFTFHQMGSASMGAEPATSVADQHNQVHQTSGLYVMDASCFPSPSGINPMISVAAIAHRGAVMLAERLVS